MSLSPCPRALLAEAVNQEVYFELSPGLFFLKHILVFPPGQAARPHSIYGGKFCLHKLKFCLEIVCDVGHLLFDIILFCFLKLFCYLYIWFVQDIVTCPLKARIVKPVETATGR
jgi:hypothetical protein